MITEIADIAVVVSDSKKALKWYTEVLGLEPRSVEGHWITVAPRGAKTVLHLCESDEPEKGNTGIALVTKDLKKTYEDLKAKGVKFPHPPKDDGWGIYAQFEDPDGNVIWLNPA
ncbi:MAG: VOC family protein [Nitrososphaerota archaeon]|jgi:predicted enzyme related to lactoylglutathione lyase|nr:VOC family protein [Nitrososphaerota archaeon]MDG6943163.1 VOC family protein [Nitrososphaerota archaeon]MDG6950959.1 VOC family protein [Nitrososphaerota archaeon]